MYGSDLSNPYLISNGKVQIPYTTVRSEGIKAKLNEDFAGDVTFYVKVITTDTATLSTGESQNVLDADSIGAKRMGLVAPYNAEVSDSVGDHFRSAGIEVVKTVCMDAPRDYEISRISDETMINACLEVAEEDIDAIFMTCAAFPAINVIEEVEKRTGKTVITSNQAMIWMAYRTLGLDDNLTNLGKLFEYPMLQASKQKVA